MEITDSRKFIVKIASILTECKVRYFITGGFAVSVWGHPRATMDIDVVIELIEPQVDSLVKALRKIFKTAYIDEDMIRSAIRHRSEFNVIDFDNDLKIDFWVSKNEELSLLKFKRRKLLKINGRKVYFISPEDLILSKLDWYKKSESARQLGDIESVLKISGDKLDLKYLKLWAKKLKAVGVLNKLLKSI